MDVPAPGGRSGDPPGTRRPGGIGWRAGREGWCRSPARGARRCRGAAPGHACRRRGGSRWSDRHRAAPSAAVARRARVNHTSTPPGAVGPASRRGTELRLPEAPRAPAVCGRRHRRPSEERRNERPGGSHGWRTTSEGSVRLRGEQVDGVGGAVLGHREHLAHLGRAPQIVEPGDQRREPGEAPQSAVTASPVDRVLDPHGDERAAHGPEKRSCPRQKWREQPAEDPEERGGASACLSRVSRPAPRARWRGRARAGTRRRTWKVPARAGEPDEDGDDGREHAQGDRRARTRPAPTRALPVRAGWPGSRRRSTGRKVPTIHQIG